MRPAPTGPALKRAPLLPSPPPLALPPPPPLRTITDTCLSPDQRFLVYTSITPVAHLVPIDGGVTSCPIPRLGSAVSGGRVARVARPHTALHFLPAPTLSAGSGGARPLPVCLLLAVGCITTG